MKINWSQEWDYFYGNRVAIETSLFFGVTAAIKTLPVPGNQFHFYEWFYDWTHQLLNITNTRLTSATIPTPPATKEDAVSSPKSQVQ